MIFWKHYHFINKKAYNLTLFALDYAGFLSKDMNTQ